jgi:hypothetical protein
MVKAKIIINDSYTKLYFNDICITYTDNKILNISFYNNDIVENYKQVYLPDSFFTIVRNSINENHTILNEMSKKIRTGL